MTTALAAVAIVAAGLVIAYAYHRWGGPAALVAALSLTVVGLLARRREKDAPTAGPVVRAKVLGEIAAQEDLAAAIHADAELERADLEETDSADGLVVAMNDQLAKHRQALPPKPEDA